MSRSVGLVALSLTSADPARALDQLTHTGITIHNAKMAGDELTLSFHVQQSDLKSVRIWAEKKGYGLKIHRYGTLFSTVKRVTERPVLLVYVIFILLLSIWLPTKILFIQVEGNREIPVHWILEKAEECGICFGASRSAVRSEKLKNALLQTIPQLQWAGINTNGCVAVITVRERSGVPESQEEKCVCSLIADRDGIVSRLTVTGGNCRVKPGQAVKRGEVLVSGYTDCGICIRAEHSTGEIYAETRRELEVKTLPEYLLEGDMTSVEEKFAIILGKKRINLYKGSGISGVGCDKIYSEYILTLPGGFSLPLRLIKETVTYCQDATRTNDPDAMRRLSAFADGYLPGQMIAGRILSRVETISEKEGFLLMRGYYACEEMIARRRSEEIIKPYGNDD